MDEIGGKSDLHLPGTQFSLLSERGVSKSRGHYSSKFGGKSHLHLALTRFSLLSEWKVQKY